MDTLLVVDRAHVVSGELEDLTSDSRQQQLASLTIFLMDLQGDAVDDDLPFGPLDIVWQFDAELVARKFYPAIHPLYSISDELALDEEVRILMSQSVKFLRRYRELLALYAIRGTHMLPDNERIVYTRGKQLELI
ncbi:hypothetical protein [Bacillus sp. JCM 19041]|uniref:hypothetical protein n=1 Tax=Bacillus sp. JCM 19041 TaxID=1460637 RepID=UPI000AE78B39